MTTVPNDESLDQDILEKYQILNKLGSGAYGHVWKVTDKSDNKQYALKKVYSAFKNDLDAQRTFREISILKKLDHPNVVKLRKVFRAKNDIDLYLVFDLVQIDLFKAVKGNYLNEVHKKYIIYQIAKSLKYIHSAGVIHRDIKPSNILIDSECKIKVCDFGLSRTTSAYSSMNPVVITQLIATRWYRAPQVMLGSQCYTQKADIWSLGCLIYEMYAQKALLPGKDNIDQIQKMLEFKGFPSEQQKIALKVANIDKILGHFSTQKKIVSQYFSRIQDVKLKKLLLKIFDYDPDKRPSAEQILKSNFLEEFLNYEPQTGAEQTIQLQHNQNLKLTSQSYMKLIYENFTDQHIIEDSSKQDKISEVASSHRRTMVERTFKQNSSHVYKKSTESIMEPSCKAVQHSSLQKQKLSNSSSLLKVQRKKQSVSLYGSENQRKSSSTKKKYKKLYSQQLNVNMRHSADKDIAIINKSDLGKFKKKGIKYNEICDERIQDCHKIKQSQKHQSLNLKQNYSKASQIMPTSPNKIAQKVYQSLGQKSLFVKRHKNRMVQKSNKQNVKQQLQNPRQIPLEMYTKPTLVKNSLSLQSQSSKLPQLIKIQRQQLVKVSNSTLSNHAKKIVLANNQKKQQKLFQQLSYVINNAQETHKKLQKKGIAQLYNKQLIFMG